ncbi:MAG: hypothetical protein JW840_10695 [Candidatus Thermoplasmatota archaeon]|nr:hypothetical protein [Candidatus Thermoplasmatota archaeon]
MTKYVFVFGAGASRDEGLPLQSSLLNEYFSSGTDELRTDLKNYFEDFYDINFRDLEHAKFPSFEEALGIIELALQKEEIFGPTYPSAKLQTIRKNLVLSMGLAIQRCPLNTEGAHNRLISRLHRKSHFKQDEYNFISFNYDILLDKALMNLFEDSIFLDYGIEFINEDPKYTNDSFGLWESARDKDSITLLKPHGSLNWMYCQNCGSVYIKGDKKSNFFQSGYLQKIEQCLKDQCILDWIIEPPSYFKKYNNIFLQNIWKRAYDILSKADKIIFIGYSMPEVDIWFKYLLKKSCFGKKKKITVIDPSPLDCLPKDQLAYKYERFLGSIDYYQTTFRTFAGNHIPFLNGEKVKDIPCILQLI